MFAEAKRGLLSQDRTLNAPDALASRPDALTDFGCRCLGTTRLN